MNWKLNNNMTKKLKLLIIVSIIIPFLVIGILYYVFYMKRVDATFSKNKQDTFNSIVLNKELGKITKVEYNNFLVWISNEKGYNCVKFKVYTKDKMYKVCSILKDFSYKTDTIGYIVNNKIYMEEDN